MSDINFDSIQDNDLLSEEELLKELLKTEESIYFDSYSIFEPREKSMFIDYPELKDVPEFKKLSNNEMKFVYMVGCRTSRLFLEDLNKPADKRKLAIAINKAFAKSIIPEKEKKYLAGSFDNHISVAIEKMKAYEPTTRMQAKIMVDKIFVKYGKIIEKTAIEDDVYVRVTSSIIDKLPELIRLKENAFGVIVKKTDSGNKVNLMDKLLNSEQDD